ncbi:unnamed protein product [Soboliphyme baturini]|uniref:Galactosylgalactosylxylosylprotein 3-beta-glucuronosyltransferase n=1 Tax=Soboliphyme baturini TaxID=241478 RepID=A0A183IGJ4_9BILA|nr:unnamed protein product [Soboliphyme baturini]
MIIENDSIIERKFTTLNAIIFDLLGFLYREVSNAKNDPSVLWKRVTKLEALLSFCRKTLASHDVDCQQRNIVIRARGMEAGDDQTATIFIITPTYKRETQIPDLVRLSHTLMLVPNVFWILIEDAEKPSKSVAKLLSTSAVPGIVLNVATPPKYKLNASSPHWLLPKGAAQRNLALTWLRNNSPKLGHGVVYFADDDNTYSLKLFSEIRSVRKVGVWPVGLAGGQLVERPIVEKGKIVRWLVSFKPERPFAIDMAGFAVNLSLILQHTHAEFKYEVARGYQETQFLSSLITVDDLEPKADNCTRVYVWHTRDSPPKLKGEWALKKQLGISSDYGMEEY